MGGLWVAVLLLAGADADGTQAIPGYLRKADLPGTMLATRERLQAWLAEQNALRTGVKLGPWKATDPQAARSSDGKPGGAEYVSVADCPCGERTGWRDGTNLLLAKPDYAGRSVSVSLTRTIRAARPGLLWVGIGSGDRLEISLNDKPVFKGETSLKYERYGTGRIAEQSRRDQLILALPLVAGENRLGVKVFQTSVDPRNTLAYYFSPQPDPLPKIWRQLRADFPAHENRLLEVVDYRWFEPGGWMAAKDTNLEQQMVRAAAGTMGPHGKPLAARLDGLQRQPVPARDPRWLDLCVTAAELSRSLADVDRLRAAVESLAGQFRDQYPGASFLSRLAEYEKRLAARAVSRLAAADPLTAELEQLKHEMLVRSNPLLAGADLLVVKRYTYDSQHYYDDYYNGLRQFGGNIYRVRLADGSAQPVVPKLEGGIFDRYDLSFDARRIAFGYRPAKVEGFKIWEIGLDGTGLHQVTRAPADEAERMAKYSVHSSAAIAKNPLLYGHWTDDMHPCYLPDGRFAFVSSRCEHSVLCGGHVLTCTQLYRVNADGSGLARLSEGMLSEFAPTMLDDGRLLYNRWEYVYKGIAAVQPLWAVRPDGSASEEIYGDNITNPGVLTQARQVPGRPNLIVAAGLGHEPLSVGTIQLIDLHRNKRSPGAMTSLTPDTEVRGLRGLWQRRNGRWQEDVYGPLCCDPYPLNDTFFLVACNPHRRYNDPTAYGIYLLDRFGNRVPVYVDPAISCWQPMLVRARAKPPVLPPLAAPAKHDDEATLVVADIYRGMDGVKPGTVKYLRVMEQIARPWSAWQGRPDDGIPGQMIAVSLYSHIWIAVLQGVVPVGEDGSVSFRVPAGKNLYFQALDENFMEVQKMRTFVNLLPGERRSCIGCHEHRNQAPPARPVRALGVPPVRLVAQPGEKAPRPLHYETDVQPVFDRHCTRCHSGSKPGGKLDLSGELTEHFNRSYESLIEGGLVNYIREWTGPGYNGSMMHAEAMPPYSYGAHRSKLIDVLRRGHYDVKLPTPDLVKLVTWIDCNVPYYGSYFGRRNLRYRGHPDFRPEPTLESASGVAPPVRRPPPVPARLAGWWPMDENAGPVTADATGGGAEGRLLGAQWVPGRLGSALAFHGREAVEMAGLGSFETMSIALWVKADATPNQWSPLVFVDQWKPRAVHFSLLASGAPNVALFADDGRHVHQSAAGSVGLGRWHHVALLLDTRAGGSTRFYLDGRLDRELDSHVEHPLVLDAFRLGAYKPWQRQAGANFQGALDDVRIYRGLLSDGQIADLAAGLSAEKK